MEEFFKRDRVFVAGREDLLGKCIITDKWDLLPSAKIRYKENYGYRVDSIETEGMSIVMGSRLYKGAKRDTSVLYSQI